MRTVCWMQLVLALAALCCSVAIPLGRHVDGLSNSKLSVHTAMGDKTWQFVSAAQPRVIKILDNFGDNPTKIKAALPGVVIVGRIYLPDQPTSGDPAQTAQQWWANVKDTVLSTPDVDYWEGYNEPPADADALKWYTQFEIERVNILAQNGRKASIGNFATGTPDITQPSTMEPFNDAIKAAMNNGGIMGVHEYSSPIMSSCFDNTTGEGWMTGRYRKWYREILSPAGLEIKLVISENGIDNGGCGSPNLGGWTQYCSYWSDNYGRSDCAAYYIEQLAWYDSVLREDGYVIGATIFQLDTPGWDQYDISYLDAVSSLISYMNGV